MKEINHSTLFSLKEINSVWRKVLHLATKSINKKGDTWSALRDNKKCMMFLESGSVTLSSLTTKGRERVSIYFESGCILGETSLFALVGDHSSMSIFTAKEDCVVYTFPPDILEDFSFISNYPELIYNLLESSASKVSYLFALLSDRNGESVREIICKHILRLSNKHKSLNFAPMISKNDFALSLGLHRSTVFRILRDLREEGIISEFRKKEFAILDIEKIKEQAYGG